MTDKLVLNTNAYLPLRDVVFHTLREAILKGELKPGERLMELQLASRLGVSRTPIREAIRMLELEGLAVTMPRKGAEVAKMTEKDMEDVLKIRKALDELAVGLACDNMTEEELKQLYVALKNFEESIRSGDVKQIAQADVEFHDSIYQAADNPKLVTMLNNLREQMYRYRVEYLKNESIYPRLIEEHQGIYDGLKRKDKEAVVEIVSHHVENQEIVVKNIIQEQE
ncbi:MAG: GntR family transcriptional regulator [Lachnospiraceae bacterium]|mgnify:CR=1 FL=1|jgi:DNA-binding GntR family transcriptional regulator|nr:GntR family transcriptional regulator [Lachnospiraceae bacterium]MCI8873138.1 GntR family transcriptional regulator [Lachnospiraceae bacterium]GFI31094.1 HTH-type transcriptional regulator McbR [Lachnospiraceae bacterium]